MCLAGYEPHQVTKWLCMWFPPKKLTACIPGTADADRAADVANEVRGVAVKISREP
jgi:hypothetical protein